MDATNQDEILTKTELAQKLKVTVSAVNKWMAKRRLPYFKLGRRCVRFKWQDVLKALEGRTVPACPPLTTRRRTPGNRT